MNRTPAPAAYQDKPTLATDKQLNYIASLMQEREVPEATERVLGPRLANAVNGADNGISKRVAGQTIDNLLALPMCKHGAERSSYKRYDKVPDGHYALEMPNDELNPIHFYRVNTGKNGTRREGFQFLDRYASDDLYPVRGAMRTEVMERLEADPKAAAVLYGHKTERCCLCQRKLTRPESREAGIGPVCSEGAGW